jgi:hypothetical protein
VGGDDHATYGIAANTGWTLAQDINQGSPDFPYDLAVEYQVVSSSTVSNLNVFFDRFNSDTASRVNVADAIVAAGSTGTTGLALDDSGQCHAPAAGNSCAITISTSNTNDFCITAATYYYTDTPSTPSDTGGHTFTQRLSHTTGHILIKEYYFIASTALANDAITFQDSSLDDVSATVLCVSGANTSSPFDSNVGLPAVQDQASGNAVTFSTSNAKDFLVVIGSDSYAAHAMSANTGWNLVQDVNAGSPDYPFDLGTECQIVSSTQSGTSVYFDQFSSSTNSRVNIVDAIVGA